MANKTIYLTEEGEEIFKKAKEMAGDSISSVITASLKKYVLNKEAEEKGLGEVILWVGTEDLPDHVEGKRIKFVGKLLSQSEMWLGTDHNLRQSLYYTRKGQFLLYSVDENKPAMHFDSYTKIYPSFKEVQAAGLPSDLIFHAEKQLPDVPCEELDI